MEAAALLDLLDALEAHGIEYWLDGGWGVDCLLGEVSRPHGDVDLVLPRQHLVAISGLLTRRGYQVIRDWLPTTLAWRDSAGLEVDLHPVDPTADGGGDQALPDGSTWHYGPPVVGRINGRAVPCCSAEEQLAMHQGYEPRPIDFEDVRRLAERFELELPAELRAEPNE